jgi:DNA-directed RNA polymerase specialized sigma24 family protein
MDEGGWFAERFEQHRLRLRAMAHRMLGSLACADDAVQEPGCGSAGAGAGGVDNLVGWLTTVVARVCLDMMRARGGGRRGAGGGGDVRRASQGARLALIDGAAGLVWAPRGRPRVVFRFTIEDGGIVGIDLVADPETLRRLELVILDG